jgi:FG-GAP-like repeat/ASPIC and UnbV
MVPDRRGQPGIEVRTFLFMNRGDGTFEPTPTELSGLSAGAINVEVADFDNDGLLDLLLAADPDNSGDVHSFDQYQSKIYRNTGLHGGRENHWLRMRFRGVSDAALMGARVEARTRGTGAPLATRVVSSKQSYKSSSPLEAHIGLGPRMTVDIDAFLAGGKKRSFPNVRGDRFVELDLANGTVTTVQAK